MIDSPIPLFKQAQAGKQKLLDADELRRVLRYDPITGIFTWKARLANHLKIGDVAGTVHARGYIAIGIRGKYYYGHRLAWLYITGDWPQEHIDHVDGNPHNNKWANLREASNIENLQNRAGPARHNKSGELGIYWEESKKRWYASIRVNKKTKNLGRFKEKADAVAVRKAAEKKYFGEFAPSRLIRRD